MVFPQHYHLRTIVLEEGNCEIIRTFLSEVAVFPLLAENK